MSELPRPLRYIFRGKAGRHSRVRQDDRIPFSFEPAEVLAQDLLLESVLLPIAVRNCSSAGRRRPEHVRVQRGRRLFISSRSTAKC